MRRLTVSAALLLLAATSLRAQQSFAYEAGVFAEYTKFSDTTHLKDGVGAGLRFGIYPFKNFELEYEADWNGTSSTRVGKLTAFNNRIDGILYWPLNDKWRLLAGGGWTGTQYHTDTTHNRYDSGGNALVGVKYCISDNWAWRADVTADFKNPSDQTPDGAQTVTWNVRLGIGRFLGGKSRNGTCTPKPAPPPPPAPAPAPPPPPAPAPPPPPPPPAPVVAAPPPPPPPAPPKPRELFTLKGVLFEFDKSTLTKGAKDTLGIAVRYLKDHGDVRVEIQGHTDSKGSDEYNMKLGERRAESVKAYLGTQGISADRVTTRSFGESQPVAENTINGKDNPAGRALNRRVVIIEIP
jgi:outer membrane protein OmpA-like peptidoglycan-associated protein